MSKTEKRNIVRLALHYAIADRDSFVSTGGDYGGRSAKLSALFREVLSVEYGEVPVCDIPYTGTTVSFEEAIRDIP